MRNWGHNTLIDLTGGISTSTIASRGPTLQWRDEYDWTEIAINLRNLIPFLFVDFPPELQKPGRNQVPLHYNNDLNSDMNKFYLRTSATSSSNKKHSLLLEGPPLFLKQPNKASDSQYSKHPMFSFGSFSKTHAGKETKPPHHFRQRSEWLKFLVHVSANIPVPWRIWDGLFFFGSSKRPCGFSWTHSKKRQAAAFPNMGKFSTTTVRIFSLTMVDGEAI